MPRESLTLCNKAPVVLVHFLVFPTKTKVKNKTKRKIPTRTEFDIKICRKKKFGIVVLDGLSVVQCLKDAFCFVLPYIVVVEYSPAHAYIHARPFQLHR